MLQPSFAVSRSEGLGPDDWLTIHMAARRHAATGLERAARRPKLAHGFVRLPAVGNRIARASVGLRGESHAFFVGQLPHTPRIMFDHHLRNSLPHIPQKP